MQGQTYAITTMYNSVQEIKPYIDRFIQFAENNTDMQFLVTKIGCGIAGFTIGEIAPLFIDVIDKNIKNICLPKEFLVYGHQKYHFNNNE